MRDEFELLLTREITTQTEVITCRLTSTEAMRRLTPAQRRDVLRKKLESFGEEILATWQRLYGAGPAGEIPTPSPPAGAKITATERALLEQRDALRVRVAALEAERDEWKRKATNPWNL